jgi:hypothetical protein
MTGHGFNVAGLWVTPQLVLLTLPLEKAPEAT